MLLKSPLCHYSFHDGWLTISALWNILYSHEESIFQLMPISLGLATNLLWPQTANGSVFSGFWPWKLWCCTPSTMPEFSQFAMTALIKYNCLAELNCDSLMFGLKGARLRLTRPGWVSCDLLPFNIAGKTMSRWVHCPYAIACKV